jgi:hypothetical protein
MVCSDCQSRGRQGRARIASRRDRAVERLRTLSCRSCGRLLPAPNSTERLLTVLVGLSRFGLAPEGRPILTPARALRGGA